MKQYITEKIYRTGQVRTQDLRNGRRLTGYVSAFVNDILYVFVLLFVLFLFLLLCFGF